jgi:catechol 2,3-dioxygenase-like lactoylglutathione lyase family enzyme
MVRVTSVRRDEMLRDHQAYATLPTPDVGRLRAFYEDRLGFIPERETPAGVYYRTNGSLFAITRSAGQASGSHTQLGFAVPDIAAEVADLRARGVEFEQYDLPQLKTVDGVADTGPGLAAWFKDPDGNLIGMIQFHA